MVNKSFHDLEENHRAEVNITDFKKITFHLTNNIRTPQLADKQIVIARYILTLALNHKR